ncbi:MAG: hypothetical protein J3R72DRAFT_503796 [Linnemannia gamsii]|nr:MAG: hypothetical protein J3R72DRAFT_503796 [Linnemannia gamsii]
MAYATVNERSLYIQGGYIYYGTTVHYQFFSLDLTQNWSTSNPPWTNVSAANAISQTRLTAAGNTMSVTKDSNTLTLWDFGYTSPFAQSYHIDTRSWEEVTDLPPRDFISREFYQAATDLTTGRVYIPGCLANNYMLQYDFSKRAMDTLSMPPGAGTTTWNHYSFIWNEVRGAFLLFGGDGTPSAEPYFYEFKPSSSTPWSVLQSWGTVPPHTSDSCMVSDVATMTWSQGPSSQSRNGMACAVSGDNMVVWGGSYQYPSMAPLVYNIKSAQWTTQYEYINHNEEQPPIESSNGIDAALIGGVIAGVVVAVILVVALFMFRKHRRRQQQERMERDFPIVESAKDQKIEVEAMDEITSRNREATQMMGIDPESQKRISTSPYPAPQYLPLSLRSHCSTTEVVSYTSVEDQIHQLQEQDIVQKDGLLLSRNTLQLYPSDADGSLNTQEQRIRAPQGDGTSSS